MSEGRIENLAALMAAIVVVLKTGDLPQKMRLATTDEKLPANKLRPITSTQEVVAALKDLRARKGWTQRDLAPLLGITQGAIGQWESKRPTTSSSMAFVAIAKLDDERRDYWLGLAGHKDTRTQKGSAL